MTEVVREFSAHSELRARTAAAHEAVDAAFARFALADAASYRDFLLAHGRVLPPLEAALGENSGLPPWRSRLAPLEEDLHALGGATPEPWAFAMPEGEPALWGLLYVLEGSRLGGKMLARQVPEALPKAFLGAGHEKGEWRTFLAALNGRAEAEGPGWLNAAVDGALSGFGVYLRAAQA